MKETKQVLITVKTYPQPSAKYKEIVCTAGVCADGALIRLYPFPFRDLNDYEKFKKFQWITVDVEKSQKDPRPESYAAFPESLKLGDVIESKHWDKRMQSVLKIDPRFSMCHLNTLESKERSLAVIRPRKIIDFTYEKDTSAWTPKQQEDLRELWLDRPISTLKKIPWKFKYKYFCSNPNCNSHNQTIEEWEVFQLYLKMVKKYNESVALEKVKETYLGKLCSSKRDPHFFVGMHNKYKGVWMIISIISPPKQDRQLFLM
ncbi:MAG: hypothetical protein BA863_11440 [Desulfovibrio sp. S3730MH75]|nr:MAG: hypothetical protein BA863_11440 [Desulfovibrio sp. S3730MH75]